MMTQLLGGEYKKTRIYNNVVVVLGVLAYIACDVFYGYANYRVAVASVIIFALLLPLAIHVIFARKKDAVYFLLGGGYLIAVLVLPIRFYVSIFDSGFTVLSGAVVQSMFFLSLLLIAYCNTLSFYPLLRREREQKMLHLVKTDSLTGLLNRRAYLEMGALLMKSFAQDGKLACVLFMDIDNFKCINDNYSHQVGDEVLVAFAKALQSSTRCEDLCCRWGGDEFTVCLGVSDLDLGQVIAERIFNEIEKIDVIEGHTVTGSIGMVYATPTQDISFEEMIQQADTAMYDVKKKGKRQCKIVAFEQSQPS